MPEAAGQPPTTRNRQMEGARSSPGSAPRPGSAAGNEAGPRPPRIGWGQAEQSAPGPDSGLPAPDSRLGTPGSGLPTRGSGLGAPDSLTPP